MSAPSLLLPLMLLRYTRLRPSQVSSSAPAHDASAACKTALLVLVTMSEGGCSHRHRRRRKRKRRRCGRLSAAAGTDAVPEIFLGRTGHFRWSLPCCRRCFVVILWVLSVLLLVDACA